MTTFGALVRRGGGWLPVIAVTDLAGVGAALALPAVLGAAIDALVTGGDGGGWVALAVALIALAVGADLVGELAETFCVASTTAWLRDLVVRGVLAAGPRAAHRFPTGDLVTRVSSNAADAARAGPGTVGVASALLPPAGSLMLLALIDLWLAAAFLGGVALVLAVLRAFARQTGAAVTAYQQVQGRIAGRLAESLAGARTIAAAGTVELEERRVLAPLPELHAEGRRTWQILARSVGQATVVGPVALVSVLSVGGLALVAGRISPGELFAAAQYAALGAGLGALTGVVGELARARSGAGRIADVLAAPPIRYGSRALPPGPGRLEFRGVGACDAGAVLLDGIDLVVPGGAAVAVVGRSGAGKSVLAALAARLREPDSGGVLLDGVPLDELHHQALRAAVGCAFERPALVGHTVGDTIGLGRRGWDVGAAARATHAHEFVSRLPHTYDTPLCDAPMSGGEAQRLGLARAWRAERLLVLDDATSSLDTVTEMQISRTLTEDSVPDDGAADVGPARRTRLIVTHRAATAARADLVVWLAEGRVRAVGRHDELWASPAYREVFG